MSKVFGRPLGELLAEDQKKHSHLIVPYFVDQAVRHILRNGMDSEGIFRLSGNSEKVNTLKTQIDNGEEIDFIKEKCGNNDVASLLKMYLRELPEPLLDSKKYDDWLSIHSLPKESQLNRIKELLESLPKMNFNVLSYVIPLLGKVAMNSQLNKMDNANLSKVLGPNLLWKPLSETQDPASFLVEAGRLNDIIEMMNSNYEMFFPDVIGIETAKWAQFYCKLFGHKKSILCVDRGFQDKQMWSCDSTGAIRIWDVATLKVVKEIDSEQGRIFSMVRITENQMWTASQKSIKVWDCQTLELIKEIDGFSYCMTRVQDHIWVGGEGKISIFDLDFNLVKDLPVENGNVIISIKLDSHGKTIWTGATDKIIRVWDVETCTLVKQLTKKGKVNTFAAIGNQIWSGEESHLNVWDATNFELIKQLEGHNGAIYDLQLCGNYLWSASWDTSVRVWDIETLESVCVLKNFHSDAVSQIKTLWNEARKCWQAWTSSWDKSVVVWILGSENKLPQGPLPSDLSSSTSEPIDEEEETKRIAVNLENRSTGLEERRASIEERKKALTLRKQALEEKKAALEKKKKEIQEQT